MLMKINKKGLIVSGVAALTLFTLAGSAFAQGGGFGMPGFGKEDSTQQQALISTLEDKDYAAWQKLMSTRDRQPVWVKFVSESEFPEFASLSLDELEDRQANMQERQKQQEEIQQAMEAGDYQAWQALMTSNDRKAPFLDQVNESNFAKFAEAHTLARSGKIDEAQAIWKELGFEGAHFGGKQGFGKGPGKVESNKQS